LACPEDIVLYPIDRYLKRHFNEPDATSAAEGALPLIVSLSARERMLIPLEIGNGFEVLLPVILKRELPASTVSI